jgi:hypothetical protein
MKLSSSRLYTDALAAYLTKRGAAAVTAELNAIYGRESSKIGGEDLRAQYKVLVDEEW